jgi:uncharacterized linocin/CFP29 family protein
MHVPSGPAAVESGRQFWGADSGRWAAEQMLEALANDEDLSPALLRTNATLRTDDWKAFDTAVVEAGVTRIRAVADLIDAGLTTPLANAMGTTVLEYQTMGDMDPATVSMDGMARSENDRPEFGSAGIPLPIIHKDFFINIRTLSASRKRNEGLDVTGARIAGRKVGEEIERMLLIGGKTFIGLPIYGYTTHPSRNTGGFGTNGNWVAAAKTGENILADVFTMVAGLEGDKYYGPYWLYVSRNAASKLEGDYKSATSGTIRARILETEYISQVRYLDLLPTNTVVLVQPTADVVTLVNGEQPQTIQWDVNGGFGVNFKAFAIQIPLVRADSAGNSGIYHMS